MTFDDLLKSALAGKGPNAAIEQLVRRIEFYEQQLEVRRARCSGDAMRAFCIAQ